MPLDISINIAQTGISARGKPRLTSPLDSARGDTDKSVFCASRVVETTGVSTYRILLQSPLLRVGLGVCCSFCPPRTHPALRAPLSRGEKKKRRWILAFARMTQASLSCALRALPHGERSRTMKHKNRHAGSHDGTKTYTPSKSANGRSRSIGWARQMKDSVD